MNAALVDPVVVHMPALSAEQVIEILSKRLDEQLEELAAKDRLILQMERNLKLTTTMVGILETFQCPLAVCPVGVVRV